MKLTGTLFVFGFLSLSLNAGELSIAQPKNKDAAYFKAVTSKLDPGGTSYLYFTPENAYKMIGDTFDGARKLVNTKMKGQAQLKEVDAIFSLVKSFTLNSGLTEIKGCGFSSIAVNNDLYRGRGVIYAPVRQGIIWKIAGENRDFSLLKKLPANTVLAYNSQIRFDVLWSWLKKELAASSIENKDVFDSLEDDLLRKGIDLNKLLQSTTGEIGMVMTVDMDKIHEINIKEQTLKISNFQFALMLGVKDNKIFKLIKSRIPPMSPKNGTPAPQDRIVYTLPLLPEFIKPTVADKGGYLFIASNPELVDILADGAKARLIDTPTFKKLSVGLPTDHGLAFSYASKNFTKFVVQIQDAFSKNDPVQSILAEVQKFNKPVEVFKLEQLYDQGLLSVFNCNIDPTADILVKVAVVPVAITAGLLAPALSKARERARSIQTMSNLKQIGLALKMYAMDNKDKFPVTSGTDSLNLLVQQNYIQASVLKDKSGCKYYYIGGLEEEMSPNLPLIIAIPKSSRTRIPVLFLDGHVEMMRAVGMTDCVEVVRYLNGKYKYKAEDFRYLLEQARKLDSGMVK
jgi:prepilin-type processing-associated H-X9-DG protein